MAEVVGLIVIGFALGALICGTMAYDKGFQAGVSWAHFNIFGRAP